MLSPRRTERPVVIVTGSSGRIGLELQHRLAGRYEVIGLDVREPETDGDRERWIHCDLTDDSSVVDALEKVHERVGADLASVVHLAAHYDFSGEPSPLYEELTVQGSRRLVQNLRHFNVEQLVFSSTHLVMKPVDDEAETIDEGSPTEAKWAYPESKLRAEAVLDKECEGSIPLVILRIAGVYDDGCHSIPISQEIRRIFEKELESYFFPGDADHGQPFVHLSDAVGCIEAAIEHREGLDDREVFLVGEEELLSIRELRSIIGDEIHDKDWAAIRIPKTVARVGARVRDAMTEEDQFIQPWMVDLADDHYPLDCGRARRRLDWTPQHRLRVTLPKMIDALERDPVAWHEEQGLSVSEAVRGGSE